MNRYQSASLAVWLRRNAAPLGIALSCVIIAAGGDLVASWLRYDRAAVLNGEVWRLLTGNFVHTVWRHLILNLAGLVLVWLLFARYLSTRLWLLITLASGAGVGLGLLLFNVAVHWYVGLSGVLHGLLAAGIVISLRLGYRLELLLLGFLVVKLLWEQLVGPMPGSSDFAGVRVVVDAHLYGAVVGTLLGMVSSIPRPPITAQES